jgi:phosphatidate cytidylyltransferase
VSRRGKDEGFHPHPGDPWHPGWSSDQEPAVEAEASELEEETGAPPSPAAPSEPGPVEAPTGTGQAPAPEAVPAGEPPAAPTPALEQGAAEAAEWTEILGVVPTVPAAAPPVGEDEGIAQTLFEWAEGRPPAAEVPAERAPAPAPPPWSPERGEGEEESAVAQEPAEPATEGTATDASAAVEPSPPPWSAEGDAAEGEWADIVGPVESAGIPPEREAGEELVPAEGEVEVAEWLEFASGPSGPGSSPAGGEAPIAEEAVAGGVEVASVPRRRLWPFGRRGGRAGEPAAGRAEEEWGREETGEPPGPQPPPWSPDALPEEVGAGPDGVEEGPPPEGVGPWTEEIPGAGEEWEVPAAGPEPMVAAAEAGESLEEPPPPWVIQSDLDRAAPIPVIPPVLPEEPVGEPGEADWAAEAAWAEEAAAPPGGRAPAEAGPAGPTPLAPPEAEEEWMGEEAEAGEWEAIPGPGAPAGAATMELPPSEAPELSTPRELISEEMFARAVTSEHRDLAAEVAAADTAEAQMQAVSAPMAGLESGVVGFEDVVELGGAGEEETVSPARSDLPVRVATGMVLIGILLGAMWVGGELLAGFIGLLAVLGLSELYTTLRRAGYQPLSLFGLLGAIGLLLATWFYGLVAVPVAVVALTVVCFFYYTLASRRRDPLTNGSLTLLGMLWVPGTLAFAFPIVAAPEFRVLVIALVATVVAADVGAYFAGRSWGSRPLAPVLSPSKTMEGLAGGVVLGIAVAVLIGHFLDPLNLRIGAALGLVVAVMAPLGDLAESMLKRSLGVKDMGSLLPGHGGVLDRVDAFLFVVPAVWVLYETLGLLH